MTTAVHESGMPTKGLRGGTLGLVAVIVIGVASTARWATATFCLNRSDPDCGTNFTWGARAFGPPGWDGSPGGGASSPSW